MIYDSIDRGLNREIRILEGQLAEGLIDLAEYNAAIKELQREAREALREECEQDGRRPHY